MQGVLRSCPGPPKAFRVSGSISQRALRFDFRPKTITYWGLMSTKVSKILGEAPPLTIGGCWSHELPTSRPRCAAAVFLKCFDRGNGNAYSISDPQRGKGADLNQPVGMRQRNRPAPGDREYASVARRCVTLASVMPCLAFLGFLHVLLRSSCSSVFLRAHY